MFRFLTALRQTHQWLAAAVFALAVICDSSAYAGCGDHLVPLFGQPGKSLSAEHDLHQSIRLGAGELFRRQPRCDGAGCGQSPSTPGGDISAPTTVPRNNPLVVVARTTNELVVIPTGCFGWMQSSRLQLSQCVPLGPFRPPRWV